MRGLPPVTKKARPHTIWTVPDADQMATFFGQSGKHWTPESWKALTAGSEDLIGSSSSSSSSSSDLSHLKRSKSACSSLDINGTTPDIASDSEPAKRSKGTHQ